MIGRSMWQSFRPNGLLREIIVGCSFGLLLGILSLRFSPLFVLGTLTAIVLLYATRNRPEIGLLGILIFTSTIIFENRLPLISIGVGSLHIPDLLLLWLLVLYVVVPCHLRSNSPHNYQYDHCPARPCTTHLPK